MTISTALRAARLALGKTQEEVAVEARMNVTQYNGYERARSRPAAATLARLAAALDTTSAALLGTTPTGLCQESRDPGDLLQNLRGQFQEQVAALLGLPPAGLSVRIEIL
jgi:transcriptional regulator with XRE-family HTH domain